MEKEHQIKANFSRKSEVIKSTAEINITEKKLNKSMKIGSCSLKELVRLIKQKPELSKREEKEKLVLILGLGRSCPMPRVGVPERYHSKEKRQKWVPQMELRWTSGSEMLCRAPSEHTLRVVHVVKGTAVELLGWGGKWGGNRY